jgi:hypothetical protein
MTKEEINTLENKVFRLECEKTKWRMFRDKVEAFIQMNDTFGDNTNKEYKDLKKELEEIKYY